jgi:hypothetical protein
MFPTCKRNEVTVIVSLFQQRKNKINWACQTLCDVFYIGKWVTHISITKIKGKIRPTKAGWMEKPDQRRDRQS